MVGRIRRDNDIRELFALAYDTGLKRADSTTGVIQEIDAVVGMLKEKQKR